LLRKTQGHYRKLFERQSGGIIGAPAAASEMAANSDEAAVGI
jgi:hypothetical protein